MSSSSSNFGARAVGQAATASSPNRPPVSAESPRLGSTIADKYLLVRELGHGGMGAVYKAENVAIGRVVALKLLHGSLARDTVALQRFEREARSTVSIAHPNIVEVLDMGRDARGAPFLVMEYVRGRSLKRVLREAYPLSIERVARITGQVLAALAAAHGRGIIHRDLKPENILITARPDEPDFVKVVDFGISTFADSVAEHERLADLTPTGLTMTTPFYASPEQIRGANGRDPRVDIYAVGVLMYEMLSGHRPFEGDSLQELCGRILAGEFAPLAVFRKDVPAELELVLKRALANRAGDRYPRATDFALALVPFGARAPRLEEPDPTDTFSVAARPLAAPARTSGPSTQPAEEERSTVHERLARALCGHFAERFGVSEVRTALEALDRPTRRALSPRACDAEALSRALLSLDQTFARGDHEELVAAGRSFVAEALRAGELTRSATPELFFSCSAALWQDWFGACRARVLSVGRGYGSLQLSAGATGRRPPEGLVSALVGVLREGLSASGAVAVSVRLLPALRDGTALASIEAAWRH